MKTQEIVTIELRYTALNKYKDDVNHPSKTITVGIYDTLKEAITEGNKVLDKIHHHWDDNKQTINKMKRFKENHLWGQPERLVTDLGVRHNTGVQIFAKIEQLKYYDVEESILNAIEQVKEVRNFKERQDY